MRLVDLNPQWVGHSGEDVAGWAIQFDCPCQRGGCPPISVMFDNPIAGEPLGQGYKWHRVGEDFEILTLTPSILRSRQDCQWHGFVTNGEIITV